MATTTTHPPPGTDPSTPFRFPTLYAYPPFFSLQPNTTIRHSQFQHWSSLIRSWCRHHRLFKLSLVDAIDGPLFRNAELKKQLALADARTVLDWMSRGDEDGGGGRRAEWVDGLAKTVVWIWWRRPEEWAALLAEWVENTGQKNVVLTLYELLEGEATISQEWHGMDPGVMMRSLNVLVKQGKAQVFGGEGQEGVKFF
ncbi:ESCRT-II subunit protein VPS25 [Aspergillus stella-maris]|uniref:ESCRT-II subunit protein VPS25 n=1 Tax=Aspergillus stella-maris TaxID=1810926 RepID=UPI003CCE3B0E